MMQNLPNNVKVGNLTANFWLLFAFVGGAALRFLRLGSKSLWFDEAHGYNVSQAGFDAFWNRGIEPVHPPLFFLLLAQWSKLGSSEFVLRSFSVLLSLFALFFIYKLCCELFARPVAITVVLLVAFNPVMVWYAQELRNYALLLFCATLSTLALYYAVQKEGSLRQIGWFAVFVISAAAMAYTHYGALFFVYFQLVFVLIVVAFKRLKLQAIPYWLVGITLSVLLYLPWVNSRVGSTFYRRLLEGRRVAFFPILYRPLFGTTTSTLDLITSATPIIIALFILAPVVVYFVCRNPRFQSWLTGVSQQAWLRWLIVFAYVIVLLLFVIPRGFSIKRHMVVFIPFFLMPIGLLWPMAKANSRVIGLLIGLSLLGSLYNIYFVPKAEWGDITKAIAEQYQPGDAIILNPRYLIHPSSFYSGDDVRYLSMNEQDLQSILTSDGLGGYERIWYIEQPGSTDLMAPLRQTVFAELTILDQFGYTRTDLYLLE